MANNATDVSGAFASEGRSFAGSVVAGLADFGRALNNSVVRAVQTRRTRNMLDGLDDRSLHDIGISRGEIPGVALHSTDHPDIPYHHCRRNPLR